MVNDLRSRSSYVQAAPTLVRIRLLVAVREGLGELPVSGYIQGMTMGRPTKYDPSYCEEVIETMKLGLSLTAFAGRILVARSTVNEWMDNYPEFSEAVRVGKAARTAALEEGMLGAESGPAVTARMFALKNADPDEWRDKSEVKQTITMSEEAASWLGHKS